MRVFALFTALMIAGCASSRPSPPPTDCENTVLEISSVMDSIWAHPLPTSVRANGNLSMKTPLYSGPTMNTEISHRKADSLLMVFRLFGVEAGRMLITQDSIFLYDRFRKTLNTGSSNHAYLPALLSIDHAMEQMLGLVRPVDQTGLQLKTTHSGLILEDSLLLRTYTIDPEYWRIIHMAQMDTSGTLIDALYFNDFFSLGESYFPRQVIYRNPNQKMNVIMSYRFLSVNDPITSMSLNLPADVERVPLPEEHSAQTGF